MVNELLASIRSVDHAVFAACYHLPHTPFSDSVAGFFSLLENTFFIWIILALLLFIREEKKDHWFFLPLLSTLGVAWFVSERVMKPFFARLRPFFVMESATPLTLAFTYSFPSTHATIAFACAVLFSHKEPRLRVLFYILASTIAFSRVYLGYHYPIDILAGALLGWGIGTTITILFQKRHR